MLWPGGKIPDGVEPEAIIAQRVERALRESHPAQSVAGALVSRTTQGQFITPDETAGPQGIPALKMYLVRDVLDDYLICHSWNGTSDPGNEGTTAVYIAKEAQHRTSRTSDTIKGVNHTYTYDGGPSENWGVGTDTRFNKIRHDSDGSTTEDQVIVEAWKDGEVIYAIPAKTNVTRPSDPLNPDSPKVQVKLLIIGRSTMWSQKTDS